MCVRVQLCPVLPSLLATSGSHGLCAVLVVCVARKMGLGLKELYENELMIKEDCRYRTIVQR